MKKKCQNCRLVNYPTATVCARCSSSLDGSKAEGSEGRPTSARILRRATICMFAALAAIAGFYVSLVFSADKLSFDEKAAVRNSIDILEARGFTSEAFLLRHIAVFRSSDNWLNASVVKEDAFAATNFPFEIVTLYPDFFTYPADDVERAAILLHEAKHLQGADEKEAYAFVWENRHNLGWTSENYNNSVVWAEVRKQTREQAPGLFVCTVNSFGDCTE